jgi:integrase
METQIPAPTLTFSHHGIDRTLAKHPAHVKAFKDGKLTLTELKFKPWYLRVEAGGTARKYKLSAVDKDALRAAKDTLNGQRDNPAEFSAWLTERDSRRGVTLGELAKDWRELKCPDHNGRPRSASAIENLENFLVSALTWWQHIPASSAETKFAEFIAWRRANSKRGNGERSADLELNSLSCLCRWAVFARKIDTNPFRGRKQGGQRPTFHATTDVTHCHESMPASDEELHRVLAWFLQPRPMPEMDPVQAEKSLARLRRHALEEKRRIIAGAWLTWCCLTGLRPGEPVFLLRHKALETIPASPKSLAPGTVFPIRTAATGSAGVPTAPQKKMKVQRLKRGQNPYVHLHPAAAEFLSAWNAWLDAYLPAALPLFPNPEQIDQPLCSSADTTFLNGLLEQACNACAITPCKPHGFGRGYYVRVRRSQGAEDPTIAGELGQTTNGKLIRDTYGDPEDMVGGALFDWLPENEKQEPVDPSWKLLVPTPLHSNIIHL